MTRIASPRLLVAVILAASIIGLTLHGAIKRGMDHAVMIGPGDATAIAISLTDTVYGIRLGYVGLKQVRDAIYAHWNRDADWSNLEQLKKNYHNRELLNAGLRAAAALGPQVPGYIDDGTLITTFYDDMGEVDYVTWAFRLFGLEIESLTYFYFALLAVASLVFIITFQERTFALCLLFTTLSAYLIEQHLKVFEPVAISTYWGMRHCSTLSLVPGLHLALLVLWRRKLSLAAGAGAVVQLAILILTWRVRGSVAWTMVFLAAVAGVMALIETWPRSDAAAWPRSWTAARRGLGAAVGSALIVLRSWRLLLGRILCWPLVFLLIALAANNVYNRASLHPVYFTDDVMTYHGIWHSVHTGLAWYAPETVAPRVKKIVDEIGINDGTTLWTARDYLDQIRLIPWNGKPELNTPAPGYLSPWHGIGLKIAWHERTLRYAYFDKLKTHTWRIAKIYASMPWNCVQQLTIPFAQAPSISWLGLVVAVAAVVAGFLLAFARGGESGDGFKVLAIAGGALATATLPNMISYAAIYAMSDSVLLVVVVMSTALGFAAYALARFVMGATQVLSRAQG